LSANGLVSSCSRERRHHASGGSFPEKAFCGDLAGCRVSSARNPDNSPVGIAFGIALVIALGSA
jgi:hypothetical protein